MSDSDNPGSVYLETLARVGYVSRKVAEPSLYRDLGFRCGLEVHQQLKTARKLFCRCPAGRYQDGESYDAQLVRHMRPTLSELGEYDGTALMEFKTRKNIIYRILGETACTYDIDDTPPFPMNREALNIAIEIALLLGTQVVGELHITRKQYLDGSIPTGFQRTAIVGIHGSIPLKTKPVRILQLSIEEDSCREVSDIGHERIYSTDRLGMPLVETVTYPDLLTPDEAREAAHYIRFLARSTGKVNVGIGAGREDVNVSIDGGTRVEIKGVQHIRWIPDLTHNEAFRQKALLAIRETLRSRFTETEIQDWSAQAHASRPKDHAHLLPVGVEPEAAMALNLPGFSGLLAHFTNPGRCFADELSDRLKVVACIEKPNLAHSEEASTQLPWDSIRKTLGASDRDAQILLWGPSADMETAIDTVIERCQLAFAGVPNETRKALADGTTLFERVLPGPDRMYPDTDSAPIPIDEQDIETIRAGLPEPVEAMCQALADWDIPEDCHAFILKRNLLPTLRSLIVNGWDPAYAGALLGHTLRSVCGDRPGDLTWLVALADDVRKRGLDRDILPVLIARGYNSTSPTLDALLREVGYSAITGEALRKQIPGLAEQFSPRKRQRSPYAMRNWIMGQLRKHALGNLRLSSLSNWIDEMERA